MHASNEIPANYFKVGPYIRKHDRLLIASIPNIFRIKKSNHFTFCNCSVNRGYATQIYRLL